MTSLANTVKNVAGNALANAKAKDLDRNTQDPKDVRYGGKITNNHGVRLTQTENWLRASNGQTIGPLLTEDVNAFEKIHRFDHERIPERVVHARGAGAHGYYRAFDDRAKKYTFANVLTDSSRTTPVFVRFSTVQGSRGSADTVRDVRGFAVKFYTEEGNWDLVGNNLPVFFIQDAIQFPDLVHAVKPEPHNEVPTGQTAHNNAWDYFFNEKASTHMIMWIMSDRTIPRSYRMMQGFGVNTYTLLNEQGERVFVKFHWIPELGVHSLVWDEALKIAGQDPDFHRKDLEEAIENGAPPKWTLAIQVLPESRQHEFDFDILDATKIWPVEKVPLEEIGELVLDRKVDEYFPETEQVAFCTSHIVPGIGFSDDPLLQGRNFSYLDTQLSRLGTNWEELPINRPVCPVMNHIRDGQGRHTITKSKVNYYPNRFDVPKLAAGGDDLRRKGETNDPNGNNIDLAKAVEEQAYVDYPAPVAGPTFKTHTRGPKWAEYRSQAQLFYNSLTDYEKSHVIEALSFELDHCDEPIVYERLVTRLNEISNDLAVAVAQNVGGPIPEPAANINYHNERGTQLSQLDFAPKTPTIKSRRVAILIADGFDATFLKTVKGALMAAGAVPHIMGPRRRPVKSSSGSEETPDHHFEGQRSTMFDAILLAPGSEEQAQTLAGNGRVVHWIRESFAHCKPIAALGTSIAVIKVALGNLPSVRLATDLSSTDVVNSLGVVTAGRDRKSVV